MGIPRSGDWLSISHQRLIGNRPQYLREFHLHVSKYVEEADHCVPQPAVSQALLVPNAGPLWRGGRPYFTYTSPTALKRALGGAFDTSLREQIAPSKTHIICVQYFPRYYPLPHQRTLCLAKATRNFTGWWFPEIFHSASDCTLQIKSDTEDHHLKNEMLWLKQRWRAPLPTLIYTLAARGSEELKRSMQPNVKTHYYPAKLHVKCYDHMAIYSSKETLNNIPSVQLLLGFSYH